MIRRPTPSRTAGLAAAAALAALLSGCLGSAPTGHASPGARQDLAPVRPLGPFDGLAVQPAGVQTRLQSAQNVLTAQCMRARGLRYTVPALGEPVDAAVTAGAYDLLSPGAAAAQGYGIADNVPIDRANDAAAGRAQPDLHRPGYAAALTGTSAHRTTVRLDGGSSASFNADGCTTWALLRLYGPQWNEVYFDVSGRSARLQQQVLDSAEWQAAVRRWSGCMNTRYHVRYPSPQAARSDVTATVSGLTDVTSAAARRRLAADRRGEVALAVQDAACQQRSGLAAAAAQAQDRLQPPVEQRDAAHLRVYRAELAHAKAVAGQRR